MCAASAETKYSAPPGGYDRLLSSAWAVGHRLDGGHRLLSGGNRSMAGSLGRLVEQRVFDAEWGICDPAMMAREYGPYEDISHFVVVIRNDGAVGAGRALRSPDQQNPLKLEVDLAFDGERLRSQLDCDGPGSAVWELATLAVDRDARRTPMIGWIIGELRRLQVESDGDAIVTISSVRVGLHRLLERWGFPMTDLPDSEPGDYFGVRSRFVTIDPAPSGMLRRTGAYRALSEAYEQRAYLADQIIDLTEPVPADHPIVAE